MFCKLCIMLLNPIYRGKFRLKHPDIRWTLQIKEYNYSKFQLSFYKTVFKCKAHSSAAHICSWEIKNLTYIYVSDVWDEQKYTHKNFTIAVTSTLSSNKCMPQVPLKSRADQHLYFQTDIPLEGWHQKQNRNLYYCVEAQRRKHKLLSH